MSYFFLYKIIECTITESDRQLKTIGTKLLFFLKTNQAGELPIILIKRKIQSEQATLHEGFTA